jgi:organic hydroperoxide reductase OsmC/OhrA
MEHHYKLLTTWKGNKGTGTSEVSAYDRIHTIEIGNKPVLNLTTDNALYGDKSVLNPEDLLVSALSSCHMMSYLYLCAKARIVVVDYKDEATGTMLEYEKGGGHFTEVTLHPVCTVTDQSMVERAKKLHEEASKICYIANSVNFKVAHKPVVLVK